MDTFSMITGTTLNRYQLDIPSCTASLDVEEFSGAEKLSELYYYTITFTSAEKNIDAAQLLSKPAMLTMGGGALQQLADCKRVHGVITTFRRVSRSEDQSTYQITLQPFLSLLDKQFRSHRFFVNKSVPEVVEQVLQEHHLHDWEYEFNLKQHYPRREQINQYQESDLAFIQRLLAEVGIFYFFTLQEEAQSEVVHFADAQRALMFDKTLPVNSPSGMSDSGAESIWGLNITHNVVEANVTTRDYNPRDAQSVLQSATADMTLGVLLFILHASGTVKILSVINIWWVSLMPAGCWLLIFCLRCYLWDRDLKAHQFLLKEAEYGQQRWEDWAGRWLAVLGSAVLLPDHISAAHWGSERPQQYGLTRRINYLPVEEPVQLSAMHALLTSIEERVQCLPEELPLYVTLITDNPSPELTSSFSNLWKEHIPGRAVPDDITVTGSFSLSEVEERLKQPVLTVNLLLVIQLNGGTAYSDGLAVLLLTSDDVAQKYHLPHSSRLLRPMPLDMTNFEDDITLFLETQTVACQTPSVIGDAKKWTERSAALITQGGKMHTPWKAEDIALLEKWCGIPGPAAPWLLAALAADLVSLRKQPLLALFSSEQEHFISTITPGSEDEYTG